MTKDEAKQEIERIIPTRRFYQPVIGFPQCTKRSEKAFKGRLDAIIRDCGGASGNSFLVGGSSNGYNCFQLESMGARVFGIESDKNNIQLCEILKDYYEVSLTNPTFIHSTILDWFRGTNFTFNYGILLMVFHHIFKPHSISECLETMNYFANRCEATYLSSRDKPWMKEKLGMTYIDIPDYLVKNTEFTDWEEIDMPRRGNNVPNIAFGLPVWKLWK